MSSIALETLFSCLKRLLDAVKEHEVTPTDNKPALRALATKHNVSATSLFRALEAQLKKSGMLALNYGRGQKARLSGDEENLDVESIKGFDQVILL